MADAPREPMATGLFTGEVSRQPLAPESGDFSISVVTFPAGVRNKFHIHESDQVLIVTDGEGLVVTDDERLEVKVGDVIFAPAGEKHWHGAGDGGDFSHVTITRAGAGMTQLEA